MTTNIKKVIGEWIGEDDVYTEDLPQDEEYAIEAYNQVLKNLRSRISELEEKIVKELQEKLVLYNVLPPQVEMENPSMWEGHQIAFKKMKEIINLLISKK
jgi:hypothetical protein